MKGSAGDQEKGNMMDGSRILVVNPAPVYLVKAMNQKRTHHMMQTLARDFAVDLATPVNHKEERGASSQALKAINGTFIEVSAARAGKDTWKRHFKRIRRFLAYYLAGHDREYTNSKSYCKEIIALIEKGGYSIVISNYWEGSTFFRKLGRTPYKILDPHYAVAENLVVLDKKGLKGLPLWVEKRKLRKSMKLEKEVIEASNLLLPLSSKNLEEFEKIAPQKPLLLIPDGSDVEFFANYPVAPDPNTILFYGAMGSGQNINACMRLIKKIFPVLKGRFPKMKLLIVGNKPPEEIKKLHDGTNIIVTGFVEDVRPWLAQAWIKVIPLELGSGFRGRVIELMAMGIPVIGTHNALDSIGMMHGRHGFIGDSDEEMTLSSLELLRNFRLRDEIGRNASAFAREQYSLEATFGKLNTYLRQVPGQP